MIRISNFYRSINLHPLNKKIRLIQTKTSFTYSFNKIVRTLAMKAICLVMKRAKEERLNLQREQIKKILLVRANFRMGNSILATPAIFLFRKNFPHARIDFLGSPVSGCLFKNLPINHHFNIPRRFPDVLWAYLLLLNKIRRVGYDLAVDVSCSQSAMSSVIIGFSSARFKVGAQGKWDHWFSVRIPRPSEINKYQVLLSFFSAIGMETQKIFPLLIFSSAERIQGKKRIETLVGENQVSIVGVFIGGRKAKGKRWTSENFLQLIKALRKQGIKVTVFFGPEEKKLIEFFRQTLGNDVPLVFEPSVRAFASMVSNCVLFITCDSGPMHLACALGVRTIAIFLNTDFKRWGPPSDMAQIIYDPKGVSVEEVLKISLAELRTLIQR